MSESRRVDLADVEFTLDWYREFLRRSRAEGYQFRTFPDCCEDGDILLRHDVDLSVSAALEMARVEADLDATATYLFLLTSPLYNVFERETREQIHEIVSLGHDVGLHFSTHVYWTDEQPGEETLAKRVADEQSALKSGLGIDLSDTVSFHIPPEWVLDCRVPGVRSAYEPAYFSDIEYVADSGQRWREERPAIEDFSSAAQVLTHPGLWGSEDAPFDQRVKEAIGDTADHARYSAHREFIAGVYG